MTAFGKWCGPLAWRKCRAKLPLRPDMNERPLTATAAPLADCPERPTKLTFHWTSFACQALVLSVNRGACEVSQP